MRHRASLDIFHYWDQLRGAADAPLRADISPASIRHILPDLFILEAGANEAPHFRLAGTSICSMFGRELREESFASLWAEDQRDEPVKISEQVMAQVVPTMVNATGYSLDGRQMAFEMILLPLRSSPEVCDRLLGSLAPVETAVWLSADPLKCLELDRSRILVPRAPPGETPQASGGATRSIAAASERVASAMRRVFGGKTALGGGAR